MSGKSASAIDAQSANSDVPKHDDAAATSASSRSQGRKYKRYLGLPHYAAPTSQLVLASVVCLLCPAMLNTLSGVSGARWTSEDSYLIYMSLCYGLFAITGFFGGAITNRLGTRTTLTLGCTGYPIAVSALLCARLTYNDGFLLFAGALLGCCSGILWSTLGMIITSYPRQDYKGRYVALFLSIYNLGDVIGSVVLLSLVAPSRNSEYYDYVFPSYGYIPFLILCAAGVALAWTLVDAKHVVREDGSRIATLLSNTTWRAEVRRLRDSVLDPYVLSLFPLFFASNWFFIYQSGVFNYVQFNFRTQFLNQTAFWTAWILGGLAFGFALDGSIRRSMRARLAWISLSVLTLVIWGGCYAVQATIQTREDPTAMTEVKMDWTAKGFLGRSVLYIFFGFHDGALQTTIYWILGALTNNERKLADYAGVYRGLQAAGSSIIWGLGSVHESASYMSIFESTWALLLASLVIAAPVMFWGIRDNEEHSGSFTAQDLPDFEVVATAGVLLPAKTEVLEPDNARRKLPGWARGVLYALAGLLICAPVWLVTAALIVNKGASSGCLPDGSFALPGKFDIWAPRYLLTLTVGFGSLSFPVAKFVDLCWDLIVGRGGQGLLVWTAYKVFSRHIVCLMERAGVSTDTYVAVAFDTGSIKSAWTFAKELRRRQDGRTHSAQRYFVMMVYISVHILMFPTAMSAMTSYAPIGHAFVNLTPDAATTTVPFTEMRQGYANGTSGSTGIWYHGDTALNATQMLAQSSCKQTSSYRWGFSFLLLFIFIVANSVCMIMLALLWQYSAAQSEVVKHGIYKPSEWRTAMDMSSHARAQGGDEVQFWGTEQLGDEMKKTRMAFERKGLDNVLSAARAKEGVQQVEHVKEATMTADLPQPRPVKRRRMLDMFSKSRGAYDPVRRDHDGV